MSESETAARDNKVRARYFRIMADQVRRCVFYSGDKEQAAKRWEQEAMELEYAIGI